MRRQEIIKDRPGPRDYVEIGHIPPHYKVLDIGPGRYPLKRADLFVDHDIEMLRGVPEGRGTLVASLESGLPQIPDKSFDYVWASHILEHVEDVTAAAATISRIGHRGTIVLPSAIKESLFFFEEPDHKWFVLPHPSGAAPIFVRHNASYLRQIKDIDCQKIMCRTLRTGTAADTLDDQYMQTWFWQHEPDLDVIFHWEGEFKPMVIG